MRNWTAVGHRFVLAVCRNGYLDCSICSAVWSSRPQLQVGDDAYGDKALRDKCLYKYINIRLSRLDMAALSCSVAVYMDLPALGHGNRHALQ